MELTKFDVIKRPLISSKSVELFRELGQYTFEVHQAANKGTIRDAVEKLWDVKVDKVRVIKIAGKLKTFNRRTFRGSDIKKAIITLRQGYKIQEVADLFSVMTSQQVPAQEQNEAEGN